MARSRNWVGLGAVLLAGVGTDAAMAQAPVAGTRAAAPAGTQVGHAVAIVNGEVITAADLEQAHKWMGPSPVPVPSNRKRQQDLEALSLLIDDMLMQQFLRTNGPQVSQAELTQKYNELQGELKKQNKTVADLCKEAGVSQEQLVRNMRTKIAWSGFASPRVTEEMLRKYYDGFKDFFDGTMVHVSHIVLRISPAMTAAERQATADKAKAIREQIIAKKIDFAGAAKQYSQEANGPMGGVIGFIPRKFAVDEAFAQVAFSLKPGEISEPVVTEYGAHLIQLNERRQGPGSTWEKAKADAREFYIEEMFQAVLAQQRKAARIEVLLK